MSAPYYADDRAGGGRYRADSNSRTVAAVTTLDPNTWPWLREMLAAPGFIYALADPRTPDVWRYIGRAKVPAVRLFDHLRPNRPETTASEWLAQLWQDGLLPVMHLLESVTDAAAATRERAWIDKARAEGHPITNRNGVSVRASREAVAAACESVRAALPLTSRAQEGDAA